MKFGFIGSRYYNGKPQQGYSYEYMHLAGTLQEMGLDVTFLDSQSPNIDNRIERASKENDVLICTPSEYEIDWQRFGSLKTVKVFILCDDEWRRDYGLKLAPYADFIMSTARDAQQVYGSKSIPFQWGARLSLYKQRPTAIPISFVGLKYGYREQLVQFVNRLGLPVKAFGQGWGQTVTDADIVEILTRSAISLTTSLSSKGEIRQIKARNFEIPASGALAMLEYAPGLEDYYTDNKEVCFWTEPRELADKLYFYRANEGARRRVAQAGKARTGKDHSYKLRFRPMLEVLGIASK